MEKKMDEKGKREESLHLLHVIKCLIQTSRLHKGKKTVKKLSWPTIQPCNFIMWSQSVSQSDLFSTKSYSNG